MRVLGVTTRYGEERLKLNFVIVDGDGPSAEPLDGWQGTRRTDLPSQLADAYQVVRNRVDASRADAIAVKRVESQFGRPSDSYNARHSLEAAVMLAAEHLGRSYSGFRTNDLKSALEVDDPHERAKEDISACPTDAEHVEAAAAAYAVTKESGDPEDS